MENWNIINSHVKIEDTTKLTQEIRKMKETLWFKKILAFSWWWKWIKVDFEDKEISEKIEHYWQLVKEKVIKDIITRLKDYYVAILTWWTKWDVPNIATKIAKENNIPTIWIFPRRWEKYSMWDDLNMEIVVDSQYGESHFWDESSLFAKLADWMFVIWWWAGTLIEFAHVMKINEALKKYWEDVKKIVPISWIPWVSDSLHYIPWDEDIKKITFPNTIISNWKDAFDWMLKELDMYDIQKETY
jgi:hypothetical protein